MDKRYYKIDEVAKLVSITKRAIRYYEDLELIKPVRTETGYRIYTEQDIEILHEIMNLRSKLGMNLAQVEYFLGLRKNIHTILDGDTEDAEKIEEVKNKIKELIEIIEEKEEGLKKIKSNCIDFLDKLDKTVK